MVQPINHLGEGLGNRGRPGDPPLSLSVVWANALRNRAFLVSAALALATLVALPLAMGRYYVWVEARRGAVLADPILARLPSLAVSTPTFVILYGTMLLALVLLAKSPERLIAGLWSYLLVMYLRALVMAFVPLDPPLGYIPLRDPLLECFTEGGAVVSKDLFFSGHTASLVVTALMFGRERIALVFWASTFAVALLVLVHHVHYTVDVLFAFPAAYLCNRAVVWANQTQWATALHGQAILRDQTMPRRLRPETYA
jgi:PAP2 superfamily C-terminal